MRNTFGKSLLGASVLALLVAAPAFAQTATKEEEKKEEAKAKGETVVITGSRIRKDSFNTASPLTVVTNASAILAGTTDAAEIIQGSTAAASSTQINNFFTGFVVEGGPGIQTVGLNSLGSQRTLVLLNGRRLPPSGVRGQVGAVDLATIPNLAVNRYEILNEGASPIYGSDAVGGVVNAITRRDVDGFEVQASGQASFGGGGEDFNVGALWGKTSDKWNVMVSAEYSEQKALKYKDRDWCQEDYLFDPTTGQRVDYVDPTTGKFYCLGNGGRSFEWISLAGTNATGAGTWILDPTSTSTVIGTNPTTGATGTKLKVPGYKRIFSPATGTLGTPIAYQRKYQHNLQDEMDIISPSKRMNFFGTFSRDLDILGGIEVYGDAIYAKRESTQVGFAQLFFTVPATNVYNPFGVNAQPVIARPANNEQSVETWQLAGGVKGKTNNGILGLFKNGEWDIYGQTSSGEGTYNGTTIRADRVAASLATTISGGNATCPTPVYGGSCLPINFFDPRVLAGNYSEAEYDYLFGADNTGTTVYEQTAFEANLTGDLFLIPGASDEVKANVGVAYRKYSIDDTPGAETLRGNTLLTTGSGRTVGEDSVKEVYGEIAMPLIAKKPMIEDLNWTVAYRYTDYDSYDSNTTWKSTVQWRITPSFQLVAISGTSYRAPQLFELFLGNQTGFLGQTSIDPCINWGTSSNEVLRNRCNAAGIPNDYAGFGSSATIFTGGGAGTLKEEESRSDIFSLIWSPTFANLNVRADLWNIEVTDQIAQFGAGNIAGACYGSPDEARSNYFCGLLTRDPVTHQILTVQNSYVNINVTEVKGIDLSVRYKKEFPIGDLSIESNHRWTLDNKQGLFSDAALVDYAGTIGDPIYNSRNQVLFNHKDWTFAWTANVTGPASDMRYYGTDTLPISATSNYAYKGLTALKYKMRVETTITHDFSVRYRNDNWTLVGGISNIFDEAPPAVSNGIYFARLGNSPLASQYDFVGRNMFVTVTKRF